MRDHVTVLEINAPAAGVKLNVVQRVATWGQDGSAALGTAQNDSQAADVGSPFQDAKTLRGWGDILGLNA